MKNMNLTQIEKKWILLCKGHFKDKYPKNDNIVEFFKPIFVETFNINPDNDLIYYSRRLLVHLISINNKIVDDMSLYVPSNYNLNLSDEEIESMIYNLYRQIKKSIVVNEDNSFRINLV